MRPPKKGRIKPGERAPFLELLATLPITVDAETASRAFGTTISLADRYRLSTYDASFLELAMRLDVPLAALDPDLRRAVVPPGVSLL